MTTVPVELRELLERACRELENGHGPGPRNRAYELRALLSEQPQASAAQSAPTDALPEEDFCYCGKHVSLQMVSGGAHPLGYLGEVTLKIDGEYVKYQRAQSEPVVPEAGAWQEPYPECDYCGTVPDHHPWHGSGLLNGVESRHIHACNDCRNKLPPARHDQGDEVRRLREALTTAANRLDRLTLEVPGGYWREQAAEWTMDTRAALAAQGEAE